MEGMRRDIMGARRRRARMLLARCCGSDLWAWSRNVGRKHAGQLTRTSARRGTEIGAPQSKARSNARNGNDVAVNRATGPGYASSPVACERARRLRTAGLPLGGRLVRMTAQAHAKPTRRQALRPTRAFLPRTQDGAGTSKGKK